MGNILLKNILLAEERKDIFIKGNLIDKITPSGDFVPTPGVNIDETIDCTGKAAAPGFVNMHTHAAMTLLRGEGKGLALEPWLKRIWAIEATLDEECIYWGTKLACLEMIKTGTTIFNDQYWFPIEAHRAAKEMGLRGGICCTILDNFDKGKAQAMKDECQMVLEKSKEWDENFLFEIGLHAIYTVSEEMIIWASEFARKNGLKVHMHVAESLKEDKDCKAQHSGLSPVEYLDSLGVLGPDFIAAHTLWLSDNDIEILGRNKVNCVHNINSNTKLSSGYRFMQKELRNAGANVCIGTDGCASSDNLDMLEALKTTALFQKAFREDPQAMPIETLLEMGTLNGAKALGINSGKIEEGKIADILIIDMNNSFFLSNAHFLSNYIYSAHSDSIDTVIANGKILMRGRVVPEEKDIIENARRILTRIGIN